MRSMTSIGRLQVASCRLQVAHNRLQIKCFRIRVEVCMLKFVGTGYKLKFEGDK